MGALRFKPGVTFDRLTVGGAVIVGALVRTVAQLPFDLTVTSATDGVHSGPTDPHKRGEAFDVRTRDLVDVDKHRVLSLIMSFLADATVDAHADGRLVEVSGGLATALFFGFLENPGDPNEHIHVQVRNGRTFPPAPPVQQT